MHVVMGVAMAGMLVARLNPLPAQFGCARQRSVGVSEIRLSLLTPAGTPLPGSDRTLKIRATAFGTLALVIVAVALGVLVITFAARVLRRGIREADPVASWRKTTERTTMDPRRRRMNSPMREAGPGQTPGSRFTEDPLPRQRPPAGPATPAARAIGPVQPSERPSGSATGGCGQPARRDRGPGSRQRRDGGGHARLPR